PQGVLELLPFAACGESFDSSPQLEIRHCGQPEAVGLLTIEPTFKFGIALALHERRNDIGIENDHFRNFGERTEYPRHSGISSFSPIPANSLAMAVPRPSAGAVRSSRLTASRKMVRTSSSMLRP